ncbi:Kunitz/Bovine pancreatic trypsin inhibitor domain protein [Oesophagostomum dentatum]|uniref:Kunitz/Bovine pancreatic trypsin inhibitor domain protein n=1 Tax=Oesophagostomum dentatum TaxID=61180 RepID=A0A0B1S580_OESDE|nr:Kunitz/Bovine pancreatic trypsin inhibitor domain protein [Oesophagostomum dentatum]
MYYIPLLLLLLFALVSGGRFPDPPVFAAPQHYPSICYLPPATNILQKLAVKLKVLVCHTRFAHWRVVKSNSDAHAAHVAELTSGLCKPSAGSTEDSPDLLTRYYFDVTTDQCYPFGVQNCGGNENRFKSRTECQNYCRLDHK